MFFVHLLFFYCRVYFGSTVTICTLPCTCMRACVHACVHACVCACVWASKWVYVLVGIYLHLSHADETGGGWMSVDSLCLLCTHTCFITDLNAQQDNKMLISYSHAWIQSTFCYLILIMLIITVCCMLLMVLWWGFLHNISGNVSDHFPFGRHMPQGLILTNTTDCILSS